jgi:Domain of unknown function (DUF4292)
MRHLAAALGLALSAAGCAHARCPAQPITTPSLALGSLRKPSIHIEAIKAEASVDQRGAQGRVKGRVLLFAQRPDHLRFDVMTQFGPALVLTADGAQLSLNDLKQGRFFAGPACAGNVARLIGVALEPAEVVRVLFGEAPLREGSDQAVRCEAGAYVLSRQGSDGTRQELELGVLPEDRARPPAEQHTYLRAVRVLDARGKALYRVRYEDYTSVAGGKARFPFTIRIEDLAHDADALVRFRSIEVNARVPEGAFSQSAPPGLAVDELFCD